MKKAIATAAIALMLSMSACTTAGSDESSAPATNDDRYLANMEDTVPSLMSGDVDEDRLIESGHKVCDYFVEFGVNPSAFMTLSSAFMDGPEGFSQEETAGIIVVATDAYCPEILDAIEGMTGGGVRA